MTCWACFCIIETFYSLQLFHYKGCLFTTLSLCLHRIDVFFAEAEVDEMDDVLFRRPVSSNHEVRRFDVAVNQPSMVKLLDPRQRLGIKGKDIGGIGAS